MSFLNNIKHPDFWPNFLKVAVPFFVIVTIFSLALNSWRDIFSGDFTKVAETNFTDGKWQAFFGYKIVFSSLYALYITNKNMKK